MKHYCKSETYVLKLTNRLICDNCHLINVNLIAKVVGPRLEEEGKKTYLFYYCIFTTISFTFRLALVLLKVFRQQRQHSCFSLKEMTAANMAILRPAASEVRAMLQKIKMDNMEKGASRRLAATAGILNSCQSANPTASSSMASTASAELLFRHQPSFYNASTSFEK